MGMGLGLPDFNPEVDEYALEVLGITVRYGSIGSAAAEEYAKRNTEKRRRRDAEEQEHSVLGTG
jgi:hypothetical protein